MIHNKIPLLLTPVTEKIMNTFYPVPFVLFVAITTPNMAWV